MVHDDDHAQIYTLSPHIDIRQRMKYQYQRESLIFSHRWRVYVLLILYQYVHNTFHNLAYYLHRPAAQLPRDLGFELLSPKTPDSLNWLSELFTFGTLFPCILFALSPFVVHYTRPLYFLTLLERFGVTVCICETLRVVSFIVTILPSPAEHCHPGAIDYDPPTLAEVFTRFDVFNSCGDLIFSGHTTYTLSAVLAVSYYTRSWSLRAALSIMTVVMGFLIVAARKHYSVDIVIAWYVIPMVWVLLLHYYPEHYPSPLFDLLRQQQSEVTKHTRRTSVELNNDDIV